MERKTFSTGTRWEPIVGYSRAVRVGGTIHVSGCTALDERGEIVGPLHGLPHAFKDFEPAVGFPFTMGSPVFRTTMPKEDSVLVERLRNAGVVPIGKTNIPEFAMGSHTYNNVYGLTRNPYDLSKSAGGSSGGAAAAVGVARGGCFFGRDEDDEGEVPRMKVLVNEERTVLVRIWDDHGSEVVEVATRDHPGQVWGPPIAVKPERAS